MDITSTPTTVLVVGGSGNTGSSIVDGLLHSGNFRVIVLTRPQSENKPIIQVLRQKGVEIRLADISSASIVELENLLRGVDTVLSVINVNILSHQKKLFRAAKNVGVHRVVPSDFTLVCPPEREHFISSLKKSIRNFIQELDINYTFIDVGWWMDLMLPFTPEHKNPVADLSRILVDAGDVKSAMTSRADIGRFVARIIADTRTVNRHVFCHSEELTKQETCRIAEEVSGQYFGSIMTHLSTKNLEEGIAQEKEKSKDNPSGFNLALIGQEYLISAFVYGDNTLETAKKLGALDALTLYPDFKPTKVKEFAADFYKNLPRIEHDFFDELQ